MKNNLILLLEIAKLAERIAEQQDPIYFTFSHAEEPIQIPRPTQPHFGQNQEKWQGRGKRRKPKTK